MMSMSTFGRAIRIDQNLLLRSDLTREQTLAALEIAPTYPRAQDLLLKLAAPPQ